MASSCSPETPAAELIQRCKGQSIEIPNLLSLCPQWKPQLNKNLDDSVGAHVKKWQHMWCTSPKILDVSRKSNIPFFVKTAFPGAGLKELRTMAKWVCWLFVYDDALDYNDFKNMAVEREVYRNDAIRCIRDAMLGSRNCHGNCPTFDSAYSAVQGLYEIGREIQQSLNNRSQNPVDAGGVMDVNRYLEMRMNTSGIYPSLSLCAFTDHIDLPCWILELDVTKSLMTLINLMISIDNDMLSAKTEISRGQLNNLVPLLMYENSYSAQSGIDAAAALSHESYLEFCNLEPALYDLVPHEHLDETHRLIWTWKNCHSGLANWHYGCKRYYGGSFEEPQVITTTL